MLLTLMATWTLWSAEGLAFRVAKLDAPGFTLHALDVDSPTALLFQEGALFLAADLLAPRPGVYRLRLDDGAWRATLARWLPQREIQGLSHGPDGAVLAVSSRRFSAREEDWRNEAMALDPRQLRWRDRFEINLPTACSDGDLDCGVVSLVAIGGDRWLAVNAKYPAALSQMAMRNGVLEPVRTLYLRLEGRPPQVTEMRRYGDQLAFLVKNRWTLAVVDLKDALAVDASKLEMRPLFDFSFLKPRLRTESARLDYGGLAEGFDFAPNGDLFIVLNNRGFAFRKSPDGALDARPKLMILKRRPDPKP